MTTKNKKEIVYKIDWSEMEPDWRAGIKSKLSLSKEYGVSRAAIDKHWAELGIGRDLSARIKAAADAKVTRATVATVTPGVTPDTKITEQEVVEANSTVVAEVQLAHRKDIPLKRELVAKLFAEIEGLTDGKELIETLTLALQQGDQELLAKSAKKVASLPSRIKGVADLVGAYKALISLEREAFGIGTSDAGDGTVTFKLSRGDAGCL